MIKKLFLIVIAILAVWLGYLSVSSQAKYKARQVKAIPDITTSSSSTLDLSHHVKYSPRPEEVFQFPILLGKKGPSQPLYAGSAQYPFYCMTLDSGLGQPLIDNQKGWGVPVYKTEQDIGNKSAIIGYSKDCSLNTKTLYAGELANGEIELITEPPAKEYQYLYQLEIGTINRFIYLIVMPVELVSSQQTANKSLWNKKLIYQFLGGSGIGFRQGKLRIKRTIERRKEQLHQGYAVVTSTGNRTSYTYNMLLAEDTARRVKSQFVSLYGEPLYTVGIGGSGGGLAQYLIGQNSEGILDALIPLYSYPDMVSQTLYALDCDLFNNYYAFRAEQTDFWQHWPNRILVEGMNAKNGDTHPSALLEPINQLLSASWPTYPKGNSECINGWFGLSTFIHNPAQGFLNEFFADKVVDKTHWNYWEDMAELFGRDDLGFANQTWGNIGVQYGLKALIDGKLTPQQFIHLNWYIGSWKPANRMQSESIFLTWLHKKSVLWLSLWSRHNITQATAEQPAPRASASSKAVEMAYRSGQVFVGNIDLPMLDVRHYLEPELDMHHMSASFASRLRINQTKGHHKHHIIWVAEQGYSPVDRAFQVMDEWLANIRHEPNKPSWQLKPKQLQDSCFNSTGQIVEQGTNVWDGAWNNQPEGSCHQAYPPFSNSRVMAGGPWQGSIFQCQLIPVELAIEKGLYQDIDMSAFKNKLNQIFPQGVCDYQASDQAKPDKLVRHF